MSLIGLLMSHSINHFYPYSMDTWNNWMSREKFSERQLFPESVR